MDKIEYSSKDLKILYFKVDGKMNLALHHVIGNKMIAEEKAKLEDKGALIIETTIEDLIQDFGSQVSILYLPKGKYKFI